MEIIVDTREQKPYWSHTECTRLALKVGDYTTKNLHGVYHIERKSGIDLCGTITKGHRRFRDEIIRAWDHKIRISIYVECTYDDFYNKSFPGGTRTKWTGPHLAAIISTMEKRYKLDIVWCRDREDSKKKVWKRLRKEERSIPVPKRRPSKSTINSARERSLIEKARQSLTRAKQRTVKQKARKARRA